MEKYLALGFIIVVAYYFRFQIQTLLQKVGIIKKPTPPSADVATPKEPPAPPVA